MRSAIVHHMAAPHDLFPPNSLEAVGACLEAKAAVIEIDVTALAEGDYLLVHDLVLESETTGAGAVGSATPEAIANLRYLAHDGTPTPYPVARLSEIVALLDQAGGSTRLQIDYKNVFPFPDDEPLQRLVNLIAPLGDRVIVSSGADWQLRKLRRLAPWLDLGFDIHTYLDLRDPAEPSDPRLPPYRLGAYGYWDDHPLASERLMPAAEYLADRCAAMAGLVPGCSTFYISYPMVLRGLDDGFSWADACHAHGIALDAWTLDIHDAKDVQAAVRLHAAGADMITTNTPRALAAVLSSPAAHATNAFS